MSSSRPLPLTALALPPTVALSFAVHRLHVDPPRSATLESLEIFTYFHPAAAFIGSEVRHGRLPLWNPHQYAGQPYLGLHAPGVLYPPNLLLMVLLEPERALEAHFALHLAIAGVFAGLFAARLGLSRAAQAAAAILYMLSWPVLFGFYNVAFHSTHAWLPAILWSLDGLLREARLRWALGLALGCALAFLGGQAQQFLYAMQLALAYGAFGLLWIAPAGGRRRRVALAALAAVLAFGLAAPQLLPALEFAREATRSLTGLSLEESSIGSIEPAALLRGLVGRRGPAADEGLDKWVRLPTLPFRRRGRAI